MKKMAAKCQKPNSGNAGANIKDLRENDCETKASLKGFDKIKSLKGFDKIKWPLCDCAESGDSERLHVCVGTANSNEIFKTTDCTFS